MANVRNREDALMDAYLSRYKSAQASTVSEGQSKTKAAQQQGSALLNATDKTLPVLKDTYSDTLQNIVSGANTANSLNNDILQRNMNLAKAKFDTANDLYEQQKKAKEYADKQAEKLAAEQEKAAAQAAKSSSKSSGRRRSSSGNGNTKADSTDTTDEDTAAEEALANLGISGNTTSAANNSKSDDKKHITNGNSSAEEQAKRNTSARAKYDGSKQEQKDQKYRAKTNWQKSKRDTHEKVLHQQAEQREKTSNLAKSAVKGAAKAVGSFLAAPAAGGNEEEKRKQWQARQLMDSGRVFTKDGQINSRYKELESDGKEEDTTQKRSVVSRAADMVKGTGKQALGALGTAFLAPTSGGSKENKQAQYKMRQMMDNGTVFTSDGNINDNYKKALAQFDNTKDKQDVLSEQFVPTLGLIREGQQQIARGGEGLTGAGKGLYDTGAMFANMVPGMALGVVNPALGAGYMGMTSAGSKIAEQTEKGRGSRDATLRGAASGLIEAGTNALPIGEFAKTVKTGSPILQSALKEGVENAGQEAANYLLNTAADYALKDPDANFSLQDMAGQVGMGAATGAAFGALGGALGKAFDKGQAGNELPENTRLYDDTADIAAQNTAIQSAERMPEEVPVLQQPDAAISQQDLQKPQNAVSDSGFLNLEPTGKRTYDYEKPIDLTQGKFIDEVPQSVDAGQQAAYNGINGGAVNDDVGGNVQKPVSVGTDSVRGGEQEPGNVRAGLYETDGTAGQSDAAQSNGQGVAGNGTAGVPTVEERARAVTGKDKRSPYTRRIISLYDRLENGESREALAVEAKDIALGIVKKEDFSVPVDESTATLKEYLKNTPIKIDEQTKGEILSASGLKNLQQYNIQNGTQLSMTKGVPYDAAIPEVYGMIGSESAAPDGNASDILMNLVQRSKQTALLDEDSYSAYTDYVADSLLNGTSADDIRSGAGFEDWLETQGFNRDAPDYVRKIYEQETGYNPWEGSYGGAENAINAAQNTVPAASDAESVPALQYTGADEPTVPVLNGSESVPENAVGAQSTQYDRREVPNRDYANQRRFNRDLDADEVQKLGADQNTHTLYTMKESADNANLNYDTYLQTGDGSISAATDAILKDLRATDKWNADDLALAKKAAEQQHNYVDLLDKGSAEYEVEFAKYKQLDKQTSRGLSGAGRTLREGVEAEYTPETGFRKFSQCAQKVTDNFAGTKDGKALHGVAEVVYDGKVDEFLTQVVKERGLDEAMLEAEKQIRKAAESRHVKLKDDEIKKAAASMLAGGDADDMFDAMARSRLNIGEFSDEDYAKIRDIFSRTGGMKDSKERYNLESEAYSIMSKYLPSKSFFDKWNNFRYLAMLGNTRTHARNILGNVGMSAVTRTKDNVSGLLQLALPQEERTKAVGTTLTKQGRELVDGAKKYIDTDAYTLLYNDGKFNVQNGIYSAQKTYGNSPFGKLLQWASDKNSGSLEKEDAYFLREAYANSMASFLKARGADSSIFSADDAASKELLLKASAQALADAKEATFHEDNFLSTLLKDFSDGAKEKGVGGKIVYAITDGILPFKKTPVNILKNSLEYSGGGIVEAGYRALKGESKARVIDAAAKGITGAAAIGAGFLLGKNGLLNGGASGDDRKDNYDEMTGRQDYSVTLPNGGTYTIDWASPAAIPLMIGAEIAQGNSGLTVAGFFDKLSHFANPVLETTMLQGLNNTLDSLQYSDNKLWDLGANAVSSYFGQGVPTVSGQIARTIDPLRRSTYGGGQTKTERDRNYSLRKMENKIPGLSMENEPYIDQWGREEASLDGTDDSAAGTALRGVYNLFSPGYYSGENVTPVDEYLQGLYDETNNSGVLPEKAGSKLTVNKSDYYMTPEEKTEYAKTTGQTAYDFVDNLRQNELFLQLPEEQQAELVRDAYTVAKTAGGVAAVGDGVSGTDSKAYKAYEQGGIDGATDYLLAKNAVDVAKGDSDTMSGAEKWNAIRSTLDTEAAAETFVLQQGEKSKAKQIYSVAGADGLAAYMDAYSSLSAGLEEGKSPSRKDMSKSLLNANLSSAELAKTYLSAYQDDDKAASVYGKYGADAMKQWLRYYAVADLDGNGSITQKEAQATLDKMDLTAQLKAAYWQMTNKTWKEGKNPY